MDGPTTRAARLLNRFRRKLGPAGDLVALHFAGTDADGKPLYGSLKTYAAGEAVNGWGAETVRGDDGALFTRITVADADGGLAAIVDDTEEGLTDFAVAATIYKVEPDETERPVRAPRVWRFRAQVNAAHVYEPGG
jgi:hypothetical protein